MTKAVFILVVSISLLASCATWAEEDPLKRRASWQAKFSLATEVGMRITQIDPDSPLDEAGLQAEDLLLAVDNTLIVGRPVWNDLTDALVAEKNYLLRVRRGLEILETEVRFAPVVKETYDDLTVEYADILSDYGIRQRTIITRPKGRSGALPAIFLVQGLSCSSIEYTPGRKSNFIRSIRNIAQGSGMVMMRVEKPGLGDSEGNCSETDFKTELNGYEVALNKLKSLPYVDPNRIVVYGSSMGSALAPYLVNKHQLNGVISDGTFFRSWFEHMLEIERRIKTMQDVDQRALNNLMTQVYIPLYYGMLVQQQSYQSLIEKNPLLAEHNYHGLQHMYGRPMAYYHQVQGFNFAGEWEAVEVPVRIRWGTHDWIMSEADNDMIAEVLAAAGNDNVELYKYPGLDHWDTVHTSAKNSFTGQPGVWEDKISQQIIDWAKDLNQQSWRTQ